MRWRQIDRIDSFEPWSSIRGTKVVSFEGASLLKPFGRRGSLPESLVLEALVELVRWLVAASSDFSETCAVAEIDGFAFEAPARLGMCLLMEASIEARTDGRAVACCAVSAEDRRIGRGRLVVALTPAAEAFDHETLVGTWRELYGAA